MNDQLKNTIGALLFILVALFFIKVFDLSYPLMIKTSAISSELSVIGEGHVEAVPNVAYVDVGIAVANAPSVENAQDSINKVNNAILEALKKLKINKQDISTSNYSVSPTYLYENGKDSISGYSGDITISIKVKKTELVSQVVEAVTKAGANRVQGVRFEIDNPDSLREQARNKAIQNAKEQAQKLAKTLGIRLGRVVNIVESNSGAGPMPYERQLAVDAMGSGGAPVIEPGSQTITSMVTLFFERK